MKLERIILENFRQYYGRQHLNFAKAKERRVTVIHGVNGAGKTSLFLAINWCLYGKSVDNVKVIDNVGELISKEAIDRVAVGESVRAGVELVFLHNGGRYVVRRSLEGTKQKGGSIALNDRDDFTMMRTGEDGQARRVSNPIGTMNAILPVNIRTYFLFDGEKIDNFAKPEASAEVKDAIYLVLKVELLVRARRHLEAIAQDYRKDLKQTSGGELRNLIEQDEKARKEREKAEKRKTELSEEIESARRKIADIDRQLLEIQGARALQQQRDHLGRELRQRQSELEGLVSQIRELATGAYPVVAKPVVDRALQVLDEKRERGEIPSSIRKQFVHDLIEQMRCICGRPFTDGSPEHQRLLNLMNSRFPGSLEDDVLDTSAALRPFDERIGKLRSDLDTSMRRRTELMGLINDLQAELDDVGRQLKGSPLEEISRLEKQRQEFRADIDSYNVEIGSLTERIEKLTEEIAQLEKDIGKARKDEKREQLLGMKLDLAQRAADALGEMYQTFADDMRVRIEAKTKEIFKRLVWKDSHFQDVRLGPDFNLEVIDRYGMLARPELSAGERQVLSLSFITAMSRTSEEEAPLVMDTPFGRLSSHHRDSITKHLPELADQLVLFVTDEELRDQARKNLEPRIGAEYRLEFDRKTSCTEIVEVNR
jgi:DNA sulfur modification protein DndD